MRVGVKKVSKVAVNPLFTSEKNRGKKMGAVSYHGKRNPLIVTIHKCANNVRMHGGGVVQV